MQPRHTRAPAPAPAPAAIIIIRLEESLSRLSPVLSSGGGGGGPALEPVPVLDGGGGGGAGASTMIALKLSLADGVEVTCTPKSFVAATGEVSRLERMFASLRAAVWLVADMMAVTTTEPDATLIVTSPTLTLDSSATLTRTTSRSLLVNSSTVPEEVNDS